MADKQEKGKMKYIIEIDNLSFGYEKKSIILDNFNLVVSEGDLIGILGPNGAGKSTILHLLSGFLKPVTGKVRAENSEISKLSNKERAELIAVVTQNIFSTMPYTVREIVEMGRAVKIPRYLPLGDSDNKAVDNAMLKMDVFQYAERQFNALSGGEKQRVKLAAALAQEPKILLLDEPTSQLDLGHSVNLMNFIKQLNQEHKITIIIVSHDIQLMSSYLDRIVMIKDGKTVADGPPGKILDAAIIQEVYNCHAEIHKDEKNRIHLFPY